MMTPSELVWVVKAVSGLEKGIEVGVVVLWDWAETVATRRAAKRAMVFIVAVVVVMLCAKGWIKVRGFEGLDCSERA